jgi:hypothetical protein
MKQEIASIFGTPSEGEVSTLIESLAGMSDIIEANLT